MFLEILFDNSSELSDQLQQTNLEKAVKKGVIAFEESNNKIFGKKIIESLLFDSTFSYLLRSKLIFNVMSYFVGSAIKLELNFKFIFEKIMRSVHIERQFT